MIVTTTFQNCWYLSPSTFRLYAKQHL